MKKNNIRICVIVISIFISLAFAGQSQAVPFIIKGMINSIPFASGGVGIGERQEMKRIAGDYNLKCVFALTNGNYLADVSVEISKNDGEVFFSATSNGPWMYLNLPSENYTIAVIHDMKRITRKVKAGNDPRTLMFHWAEE
jgi:hypothetical protein